VHVADEFPHRKHAAASDMPQVDAQRTGQGLQQPIACSRRGPANMGEDHDFDILWLLVEMVVQLVKIFRIVKVSSVTNITACYRQSS